MKDADVLKFKGRVMTLEKPVVMGILNVTPDSFSDGGKYANIEAALEHAARMLAEGATIIDIGGESTRPGFKPVSEEEEARRVIPAVREVRAAFPECVISVDTMKAGVAEAAVEAGADIVNDVSGLADPRMVDVVLGTGSGLVLMHGYREHTGAPRPATPGNLGRWMVNEISALLEETVARGVARESISLDPGFGFGKKREENGELLKSMPELVAACGRPVLIGGSRKHFVNGLYPEAGGDVVAASVRFAVDALRLGCKIFRVHDVVETCVALGIALK